MVVSRSIAMKKIIPHKLVVTFSSQGEVSSAILQYKTEVDGAVKNEFSTMSVLGSLDGKVLKGILTASKAHVETGEKIS